MAHELTFDPAELLLAVPHPVPGTAPKTVTSALLGTLREDPRSRAEFSNPDLHTELAHTADTRKDTR